MTRLGSKALALAIASTLGACAQGSQDDSLGQVASPVAMVGLDVPEDSSVVQSMAVKPRGIFVVAAADEKTARIGPGPQRRIIYMNRQGGTFTPGNDNSAQNTSIVPNQTSQVSAWSYGDAAWSQLMGCVRLQYARFDIEVTDVEPAANVAYIESVTGGTPAQVGLPNGVGGVAPVAGDCSVVERAVTFTFAAVYQGDIQSICETVAQETSHALGLDHELLCEDPMTYLFGCGAKSFQDQDVVCGEDVARTCMCNTPTQNSVKHLLAVLGPADNQAPIVDITEPADGAQVAPSFAIAANATDNGGVTKVDLLVDGVQITTDATAPYGFTAPANLSAGSHTIEVRAYDSTGGMTADTVTVNLSAGGDGDGDGDGNGNGDGSGNGNGTGNGAGGDEVGAPPTILGGCSAASGGSSTTGGLPALLLFLAAMVLVVRRRAR